MKNDNLKLRTKEFAKRIIKLCRHLPRTEEGSLIRRQVFRSGTSVGANYRAACRSRSQADFISKMGIVLEEADETLYWLEIIVETEIIKQKLPGPLMRENNELVAIFVASLRTAKKKDSRKDINAWSWKLKPQSGIANRHSAFGAPSYGTSWRKRCRPTSVIAQPATVTFIIA